MKLDREDREHIENGELILNNFQKSVDNKKEECYNEGAIVESSKNSLEEVLINKLKSMGFTHEFKPEGWYDERGKYIKDDDKIWICRNCGHVIIGKKAPNVCPVCNHPQSYFEIKKENY